MKIRISLFAVLLASFSQPSFSQNVLGGNEPVNCTETIVYVPNYWGTASCTTNSGVSVSEFIRSSSSQTVLLRAHDGSTCWDTLPNTEYLEQVVQSCEYTPKASIQQRYVDGHYDPITDTTYYQVGVGVAAFEYSDSDGHIINVEKWVNGNLTTAHHVDVYEESHVRLRVTDDDGHVTDISTTIRPLQRPLCERGGIEIRCPRDES